MKKLLKLTLLLATCFVFVNSCDKDDEAPIVPSKRVIFTSEQNLNNTIRVDSDLTFGDVSTGVESRTWNFPEGVANVTQSGEDVVKAIFRQVGEHDVVLNQTFRESAFVGNTQIGTQIDTTITVTVVEHIKINLQANYVNPDGSLGGALNLANNAQNEVQAGRFVRYSFEPLGQPQRIEWSANGGNPSTLTGGATEVDVQYGALGVFGIDIDAGTPRPFGEDAISFTNLVKVIPSADPVFLNSIEGRRDGSLTLVYSREMDASSFVNSDFAVSILDKTGTNIPANIQSITLDPNAGNTLVIAFDNELVYVDDTVNISYTAGSLKTADQVEADSFANIRMDAFEQSSNVFEEGGMDVSFENSTETNWPYQFWGAPWDLYNFSVTATQAHSGINSASIEILPNGGMIIGHTDGNFTAETGKDYEMGVWTYVESVGNNEAGQFDPDLRLYWFPSTDWGVGPNPAFVPDFTIGEWVFTSIFVKFTHDGATTLNIRGFNEFNSESVKLYMDDLSLREVILRP